MPSLKNKCLNCPLAEIDTTKALTVVAIDRLGKTVVSAVNCAANLGGNMSRDRIINKSAKACVARVVAGDCDFFKSDITKGFVFKNNVGK